VEELAGGVVVEPNEVGGEPHAEANAPSAPKTRAATAVAETKPIRRGGDRSGRTGRFGASKGVNMDDQRATGVPGGALRTRGRPGADGA